MTKKRDNVGDPKFDDWRDEGPQYSPNDEDALSSTKPEPTDEDED